MPYFKMVNPAFAALAVLALSHIVGAFPTASTAKSSFSFVDWVDGIIANPDGEHLTPEEAVAAFHAAGGSNQAFGEFAPLDSQSANRAPPLSHGR